MDDGVAAALFTLTLGLPLIILAALFAGLASALAAFALVGSLALTFFVANWIATTQETTESDGASSSEPQRHSSADRHSDDVDSSLETLRERYARGELSEAEFERKTTRLLETESVEDARRTSGGRLGDDSPVVTSREPTDGESADRDLEHDPN